MKLFFLKIFIILVATITPLKIAYCEVFIVAKVNQEIITNLDVDFEERYLVSLNPSLKKLDQNRIFEYAKNSLINEKIKKIEIEQRFRIIQNETLLSKVIADIYSSIGISSLSEFETYLSQNNVALERVKEKITIEIEVNDETNEASTSNGLENFDFDEEQTPELFNSDSSENSDNEITSLEQENKEEDEDLEIPAFLRRQKN